jgi:outer membrane protein assembly factor BamB
MPSHTSARPSPGVRASSPARRRALRALVAGVVALAVLAPAAVAVAKDDPLTIPLPAGSSPEDVTLGQGRTFYTGSLTGNGIFAGDLRTGRGHVLVPGQPGHPITGLYVDDRNRLWAAGGPAGDLRVYDAATGAQLASYTLTGPPGFVSDIVVTDDAAYVTDSFQPQMYTIPLGHDGRLPGQYAVRTTRLTGDFVQTGPTGTFNANGIAFFHDRLVIGQTVTGTLFSVDPATGVAKAIDLGGQSVVGADGLMLRNNTLYIAQNFPNLIALVHLDSSVRTGQVERRISDPRFDIPSSVIVSDNAVYALNARFSTPVTPDKPYDLVGVGIGRGGD